MTDSGLKNPTNETISTCSYSLLGCFFSQLLHAFPVASVGSAGVLARLDLARGNKPLTMLARMPVPHGTRPFTSKTASGSTALVGVQLSQTLVLLFCCFVLCGLWDFLSPESVVRVCFALLYLFLFKLLLAREDVFGPHTTCQHLTLRSCVYYANEGMLIYFLFHRSYRITSFLPL